jgi:hypothetical protein
MGVCALLLHTTACGARLLPRLMSWEWALICNDNQGRAVAYRWSYTCNSLALLDGVAVWTATADRLLFRSYSIHDSRFTRMFSAVLLVRAQQLYAHVYSEHWLGEELATSTSNAAAQCAGKVACCASTPVQYNQSPDPRTIVAMPQQNRHVNAATDHNAQCHLTTGTLISDSPHCQHMCTCWGPLRLYYSPLCIVLCTSIDSDSHYSSCRSHYMPTYVHRTLAATINPLQMSSHY